MSKLIERRHFLMRALDNHNITQEEYDKEMPGLKHQIAVNLQTILDEQAIKLNEEIVKVKKVVIDDGNLKRAIANILIKFLEQGFEPKEIKGIMRQGYKLMRGQ